MQERAGAVGRAAGLGAPGGEEIKAAGFEAPDWVKTSALEKLVPMDLLSVLVGRPELDTYARKLHWARCQMEHAHGASQARAGLLYQSPSPRY